MKGRLAKWLAALLAAALLLTPAAMTEEAPAVVPEAVDEAVGELTTDLLYGAFEMDLFEGGDDTVMPEADPTSGDTPEGIVIGEEQFPDPAFRAYIMEHFDTDDANGILTEAEIRNVVAIDLNGTFDEQTDAFSGMGVTSLAGIEVFSSLVTLQCMGNPIGTLDVSGLAALESLYCANCVLTSLKLDGCAALKELDCHLNNLSQVDIGDCPILIALCTEDRFTEYQDGDYRYPGYYDPRSMHRVKYDYSAKLLPIEAAAEPSIEPAPTVEPTPVPAAPEPAPVIPTIWAGKKTNKAKVTAAPGSVYQLDLNGATGKKFKSFNKKVATVNASGLVTIKKAGKAKITVKVGKKTRTVKLTVKDSTIPKSITLNMKGTVSAKKGESVTLTYTLPEGTRSAVKWKSSNKKVATVKNGVVTFKKAGKVTITATCSRGKKKAKVKFKVSK